jgi:peptidoglycan/xylan/chitin deacetylase (PgdA/CDA1 family)
VKNFHKRVDNECTILLYHGVTKEESQGIENHNLKHIKEIDFIKQMDYVKEECNPISIDDFISYKKCKESLPPKSVIVSFDDGFKNNYTVASPVLIERGIPAVFYISSGVINTDIMFWVDDLEDCINRSKSKTLSVKLENKINFPISNNIEKIRALTEIKAYCKQSIVREKDRVVREVRMATNITPSVASSKNYEKLNWDEVRDLHSNPLFTIGGHSLYHNILSLIDDKIIEQELRASIDLLEINLNSKIKHYSYPEGQTNHYNLRVINILKNLGIVCSPSAMPGLNTIQSDLFNLKRTMVDFNDPTFSFFG